MAITILTNATKSNISTILSNNNKIAVDITHKREEEKPTAI